MSFLFIEELVSEDGEYRRINFRVSQTVEELKRAISAELGIQREWKDIALAWGQIELDDLKRTLDSYGVFDGDTVFYTRPPIGATHDPAPSSGVRVLKRVLFRNIDGKTLVLDQIPESWTVKQLRETLGWEKNLSDVVDQFRFIWNGKQLDDSRLLSSYGWMGNCIVPASQGDDSEDDETLDQYHFTDGNKSSVRPTPSGRTLDNLYFQDLDRRTMVLHGLDVGLTLKQVRLIILHEKGMDWVGVRFLYAGKTLEDDKTLEGYCIREGGIIRIVHRMPDRI